MPQSQSLSAIEGDEPGELRGLIQPLPQAVGLTLPGRWLSSLLELLSH